MKKIILISFFFLISFHNLYAQGSAGSSGDFEPRFVVDMPTAGIIGHLQYAADVDFYQNGGALFGVSFGLLNTFNVGLSYGGTHLIGSSKPEWNKFPGMSIKARPFDESQILPAIALGFDSQGKEIYIDSLDRYAIKSPGIFLVISKNFSVAGFLSVHSGINYSLERADSDKDLNLFFGAEKTLGNFLSIIAEYNLAINDSDPKALGEGYGYLNLAVRISIGSGFTLGVNLKDIFKNQHNISIANRTISVEYIGRL
ncbi:MAG: hypothetical protein QME58_04600 [Bacteroidota bacterium]|nr:hypothetical protein [Bacteroidota bacterium]